MTNRPTWSMLKATLRDADAPRLLELVHELYRLDARNREFLHARFVDRAASLDRARKAVDDALCPDPFSKRGVRLSEGRQAIRDYVSATGDSAGELDLMFVYVEAGTAFATDFGVDDEAFFASLDSMLAAALDRVRQMRPQEAARHVERFEQLADTGRDLGWGWGDTLDSAAKMVVDHSVAGD